MRPSRGRTGYNPSSAPVIEPEYRLSGRMAAPIALIGGEISANGTVEFSNWRAVESASHVPKIRARRAFIIVIKE